MGGTEINLLNKIDHCEVKKQQQNNSQIRNVRVILYPLTQWQQYVLYWCDILALWCFGIFEIRFNGSHLNESSMGYKKKL